MTDPRASSPLRLVLAVLNIEHVEVARAVGVQPSLVSAWIRGARTPSPAAREAILRVASERMFGGAR
jgi:transposase-like protein